MYKTNISGALAFPIDEANSHSSSSEEEESSGQGKGDSKIRARILGSSSSSTTTGNSTTSFSYLSDVSIEYPSNPEGERSSSASEQGKFKPQATASSSQSQAVVITSSPPRFAPGNLSPDAKKKLAEEQRRNLLDNQALIAAAKKGSIKKINELIARKVDINRPDAEGLTALHYAASLGRLWLLTCLIENGADKGARTKEGYTPLMLAAKGRKGAEVEALVSYSPAETRQADATSSSSSGAPAINHGRFVAAAVTIASQSEGDRVDALQRAVTQGDMAIAARYIASGVGSLDEEDAKGNTLLALAATQGYEEMIRLLLCAGARVDTPDTKGRTPLMLAVAKGHLPAIAALRRAGALATATDNRELSALSQAVHGGDPVVLHALLDGEAGPTATPASMQSLLIMAAGEGRTEMVKILLAKKADLPDKDGSLTLAVMAKNGQRKAVVTLLQAGANPGHRAYDGHTAFTLAAANDRRDIVKTLMAHLPPGCSSEDWMQSLQNQTDKQGRTALMFAVLNQKYDMVELLLKNKADPHKRDCEDRNAILWAAAKGNKEIVALLMGYRATHVSIDKQGNTVFLAAAGTGNIEIIKLFCLPFYENSVFDINTPNKDGDTPLITAARHGHLDVVETLLNEKANLLCHNNQGRTALLESAANGHVAVLHRLQQTESALPMVYPAMDYIIKAIVKAVPAASYLMPDLQSQQTRQADKAGNSIMHLVASNGHQPLLGQMIHSGAGQTAITGSDDTDSPEDNEFLLGQRPARLPIPGQTQTDIEITNKEGMTPLCLAIRNGHYPSVTLLVEQGASVNHVGTNDVTPLWLACRLTECARGNAVHGRMESVHLTPEFMVDLLLRHGALPDQPSFQEQTPLIAASAAGNWQIMKQLIAARADVNHTDAHGLTPLMYASHFGHIEAAAMLLRAGAAPDPRPGKLSALILAAEGGHDELVRLLIERGAQKDHADEYGATALIKASIVGKLSTVALLIRLGVNLQAQDNFGNNAWDHANLKGHYQVAQALKKGYPKPRDS